MIKRKRPTNHLEQAKYLWEEYRYRHDHIWQLVFRFTTSVVLLSTIPYIQTQITARIGWFIGVVPLLATILGGFGILVVRNELELFRKIKKQYRELQKRLFPYLHHPPEKDEGNIKNIPNEKKRFFGKQFLTRKPNAKKKTDAEDSDAEDSDFNKFVLQYLCALTIGSVLNMLYIFFFWIPQLQGYCQG